MNNIKPQLIVFGFSVVPYLLLSWGYSELTDGTTKTFWISLAVLFGFRLFFSIIELIGSVLTWRLYGKKFMIDRALEIFRNNGFPMREYSHDNLGSYLARIESNEEISQSVKRAAKDLETLLIMFENQGILAGARTYSATEIALDLYAPRNSAHKE